MCLNYHRGLALGTHSKRPGDAILGRNPRVMNLSLTASFYFCGSERALWISHTPFSLTMPR